MPTGPLTPAHVALLLIVLLLIFGPKRLRETGRALGRGIRDFKDAITGDRDSSAHAELEPPAKPQTTGGLQTLALQPEAVAADYDYHRPTERTDRVGAQRR